MIADLLRSEDRLAGGPPAANEASQEVRLVAREGDWRIIGLDPAIPPQSAWRELLQRGWRIAEIRRDGDGLEDRYLTLTKPRAA